MATSTADRAESRRYPHPTPEPTMSTTRSPIDEIPDLWPAPPERGASGRSPRARAPFRAGFGIALHMHQPLIPAGDRDLETAPVISNLELMLGSSRSEDAYNAQKFLECYRRLATILPGLLERGAAPGPVTII